MNYYNSTFVCTYQLHDDDDKNDIYRTQLLQAFNMDEYNDDIINKNIEKLYYFFKENNKEYLNQIINVIKNNCNLNNIFIIFNCDENDEKCYFNILFMFDLFYLSHKYFCDLINNGIVKKNTLNNLISKINKL